MGGADRADSTLKILTIPQGQWGERIAENIRVQAPPDWTVETWAAPRVLPPIVDDPEDFLPAELPQADLIVSLGDVPGLVQLIPEAAQMCGAKAVIAPIDRNASLPPGLAGQLETWLTDMDVAVVLPKPFCSLTETTYNRTPQLKQYDDPTIRRFAERFGKPEFQITVEDQTIVEAEVIRDAACGCVRFVSENIISTTLAWRAWTRMRTIETR